MAKAGRQQAKRGAASQRCTAAAATPRGSSSLAVLETGHNPTGAIRKSKSGKRRAVVLVAIQIVLIAHIVQWKLTGRTLTPIEPSESVQTLQDGVINVGFIFFAVALLSTLILGRWFCGWGCHIVMLQDFCGWIMKKLGIQPKPFRSRLLLYVTPLLASYMFLWPVLKRFAGWAGWMETSLQPWKATVHLTTEDFWATFPGVMIAVPFLGICGFLVVYLLGAKGYCTYGCPYGGFFAPLDTYAPGRILVTDACAGCGHCTAVCTSNVRVHEEVREYGMVVDPGCMKCLDCVSVCPTDALYFGFSKPAKFKGPPKNRAPKRHYDLTAAEEVGLAVVYAAAFLSVFGVYSLIPFLTASGMAAAVTFIVWKAWRLARDPNVRFHKFRFKTGGSLSASGRIFAAIAAVVIAVTAHSGLIRIIHSKADSYAAKVVYRPDVVFSDRPQAVSGAMARDADRAIEAYRRMSSIRHGGIGLLHDRSVDSSMAWVHVCKLEFDDAARLFRRSIESGARNRPLYETLGLVLQAQNKDEQVVRLYDEVLAEDPTWLDLVGTAAAWHQKHGRADERARIWRAALDNNPNSLMAMMAVAHDLLESGERDEAQTLLRRMLRADPDHAWANAGLSWLSGASAFPVPEPGCGETSFI